MQVELNVQQFLTTPMVLTNQLGTTEPLNKHPKMVGHHQFFQISHAQGQGIQSPMELTPLNISMEILGLKSCQSLENQKVIGCKRDQVTEVQNDFLDHSEQVESYACALRTIGDKRSKMADEIAEAVCEELKRHRRSS